jgi:hypothetical protein
MMILCAALFGALTLSASVAESLGSFRVGPANTNTHVIDARARDQWVTVEGGGSTDLDCWLYDESRQLVDSDTDTTDYCVLSTTGSGRYRLIVRNKGSVATTYVLRKLERLR